MVPEVTYRCGSSSVEILQPRLRFGLEGTVFKNLGVGFSVLFLTAFVTSGSAFSGHMARSQCLARRETTGRGVRIRRRARYFYQHLRRDSKSCPSRLP